jgi:hypothetical protein
MPILRAVVALAALFYLSQAASAQSLGELAEKEKEKRQGKPKAKVITENDLGRSGKRGTISITGDTSATGEEAASTEASAETEAASAPSEAGPEAGAEAGAEGSAAAGAAAPKKGKEKTPDEIEAERRAEWRKKLDNARERVSAHQQNVDAIQFDLNDPTVPFYGPARNQRLQMLEDEKAKLSAAKADLEKLEEEGRRNGWPR